MSLVSNLLGRKAWLDEFGVRLAGLPGREDRVISSFWVDMGVLTYAVCMLLIAYLLTPDAHLVATISQYPIPANALAFAVVVLVSLHAIRTVVATVPKRPYANFRRDFAAGYAPYVLFSSAMFLIFPLLAIFVWQQFVADQHVFDKAFASIAIALDEMARFGAPGPAALLSELERVNALVGRATRTVVQQVNTVFLLLMFGLGLNLLIAHTPIRHAYTASAILWTHMATVVTLVVVVLMGSYLYVAEYLALLRTAGERIALLEPEFRIGDWIIAKRYYEFVADMRDRQGVTGFLFTVSTERGGVLVLVAVLNWFLNRNWIATVARHHTPGEKV
jgi:energy-converting hydrogenase Eha subunit A